MGKTGAPLKSTPTGSARQTHDGQATGAMPKKPTTYPAPSTETRSRNQSDRVDSWRSYRNDTINLQSLIDQTPVGFNPTAPAFAPGQPLSHPVPIQYTPYQPLRISNGQRELQATQQTRGHSTSRQRVPISANNSNRYMPRAQQDALTAAALGSDHPVPSIEPVQPGSNVPKWRAPTVQAIRRLSQQPERFSRTPTPPPAPQPTKAYTEQAQIKPARLTNPQRLLVILDLNGTLLLRNNRAQPTNFQMRPGVPQFLEYLFENHVVMVYTSSRPDNALGIVNKLMHPLQRNRLAALWARDKLDLTKAQYNGKVQVYKKLEKIWADANIQRTAMPGCTWNQSNTILVDDSHLKALAQPHNLIQVPEFINDRPRDPKDIEALNAWISKQQQILLGLQVKLEELKWQTDVSRLIREWQNKETQIPRVPGQGVVVEESIDQNQLLVQEGKIVEAAGQKQLLTPKSPVNDVGEASDEYDPEVGAGVKLPDERKSVSPIDESVWSDILSGGEEKRSDLGGPRTPDSIGR